MYNKPSLTSRKRLDQGCDWIRIGQIFTGFVEHKIY